jgi:hypothetical protein
MVDTVVWAVIAGAPEIVSRDNGGIEDEPAAKD